MRILLDECVNPRLKIAFPNHEVRTVLEMGWRGVTNGRLLTLAEANDFHVFLTLDQNLSYQQNLSARRLGFIVVRVPDNNMKFYEPLLPDLAAAAETITAGQVVYISSSLVRE